MQPFIRPTVAALALALLAGGTAAQQTPVAGVVAAFRQRTVDSVAVLVEQLYVSPDTGRLIAEHLRRRERAGAYASLTTLPDLARALTDDLRATNGDKHLSVAWRGGSASSGGPRAVALEEPANGGIEEVRRLEGNVGYLRLGLFAGRRSFEAAARALRELEGADAVIVDVRGVPGGTAQMSNFIVSHFTAPGLVTLVRYDRATGETTRRRTLEEVPGPRRPDVPLFVLADARSFSAAEDFAFVLQSLGRATIVGERTGGGGHGNRQLRVGDGLVLSVSTMRVFDPRTGRGWEGVGVQPDIAVPSSKALEAAHREALRRLGRRAAT